MNVLITAASRRVPLVQAFRQALSSLGVPGRVVVTDVNPLSPAVQVADRAYRVPLAHDPEYLQELLKICEAESIRLAVPTIDDEVELFGAARSEIRRARCHGGVLSAETAALCNDKYATWRHLADGRHTCCAHLSPQGPRVEAALSAVHQAAHRPWRRRCAQNPEQAGTGFLRPLR